VPAGNRVAHLIEKHERAYRAALARREDTANLETTAKVAGPRHDDRLDRGVHRSRNIL
jgi:hypothetical protein